MKEGEDLLAPEESPGGESDLADVPREYEIVPEYIEEFPDLRELGLRKVRQDKLEA